MRHDPMMRGSPIHFESFHDPPDVEHRWFGSIWIWLLQPVRQRRKQRARQGVRPVSWARLINSVGA